MQEENDHVGEQNGQRAGHKMHLGNQVCGDNPDRLKKQADIVAHLEFLPHFLLAVDLYGVLHRQAENGEIQNCHHGAASRAKQNAENVKLADAKLTQKKQPRDHDNVAHQRADGDAGDFFFGCCL